MFIVAQLLHYTSVKTLNSLPIFCIKAFKGT